MPDPALASSWEHCRNIVLTADKCGYDNILLPSGYALGMDTTVFAAAIAPLVKQIRLLMAVRIGEDWPPQLARRIVLLEDCASPVVVPGVVDFSGSAEAAYASFAAQGARIARSTDPLVD